MLRPDESFFAEFGGSKWGYSDQDYYLSVGRLGTWQFDFLWDQTPHIISTTARLLATEPQRGVFVLPTPRPPLPAHNSAPDIDEIGVRWDKAVMRFMMKVEFQAGSTSESTRARVTAGMKTALASLPIEPTSVRVTFTDENGPKRGEAIRCALEVRLPRRPAVHVADVASTPRLAFDAALAKLERALRRLRETARESKRRPKKYFAARRALAGG